MRQTLCLTMLLLLAAASCEFIAPQYEAPRGEEVVPLEVHLNNNFDRDDVVVWLDGRTIFDGRITTNYVLSLAEVVKLTASTGRHRLEVEINGANKAVHEFDLDRTLFVHVRFYPEGIPGVGIRKGVTFESTHERPLYD